MKRRRESALYRKKHLHIGDSDLQFQKKGNAMPKEIVTQHGILCDKVLFTVVYILHAVGLVCPSFWSARYSIYLSLFMCLNGASGDIWNHC